MDLTQMHAPIACFFNTIIFSFQNTLKKISQAFFFSEIIYLYI